MRKPIIAGNWKMNGTIASGSILIEAFNSVLQDMELSCDVVVCPPFTAIERAVALTRDTAIEVGAQTMDYHDAGAFTGEISPLMLTEVGVNYVIIGHSERREYYGETDETVNAKIKSAFHHNLTPIVCVGESLEQREAGHTLDWITAQLKVALVNVPKEQVSQLIIAYEPIWAIGTGKQQLLIKLKRYVKKFVITFVLYTMMRLLMPYASNMVVVLNLKMLVKSLGNQILTVPL